MTTSIVNCHQYSGHINICVLELLLKSSIHVWCWIAWGLSWPSLPNESLLAANLWVWVLVHCHSIGWGFAFFPQILGWNYSCCILHIDSATSCSFCLFQGSAGGTGIWVQARMLCFRISHFTYHVRMLWAKKLADSQNIAVPFLTWQTWSWSFLVCVMCVETEHSVTVFVSVFHWASEKYGRGKQPSKTMLRFQGDVLIQAEGSRRNIAFLKEVWKRHRQFWMSSRCQSLFSQK